MNPPISQLSDHFLLPEARLLFHPERRQEVEEHPLIGLVRFGPYSRNLLQAVLDPIRIAIIAPFGGLKFVKGLLTELHQRHRPSERRAYLTEYPGFTSIFRVGLEIASDTAIFEFPQAFDEALNNAKAPYVTLAEGLSRAISVVEAHRHEFDIIAIYLPHRWQAGFYSSEIDGFDLHDYLKATMATRGIPTQIITDNALTYKCRCSVAWRLSIALYCKAGGVPWKMASADPETAFIGLSYAMREQQSKGSRFVTCCSQVFDSEGSGLEFVAFETDDVHVERDNPFLSRNEMRRVMSRSLGLYQRRHGGRIPQRVVVHKSTQFKSDEIEGCFDAFRGSLAIDLIQVQQDVGWRGVLIHAPSDPNKTKGAPDGYPVHRGTSLQLDGRTMLLWTQGNAPTAVGGKDFYKEGKGIPTPLMLRRYAGHGSWEPHCQAILGLTKMNWNNDGLYDRLPVTLAYAQVLARVIKRMPTLNPQTYQFRYFM
ncbi:Piwi domain-containing protein [Prosthecobacter debontii]|uniref:Piwi domain-containing protein n=1 Tax=Prosthecobacter debontii TaxID=48467 RepID=A0A1T4Y3T0_9BACT|nr:hypothetical protein [Prosthecobacter debontii]SKA96477.1 Piwi domain-containing protein [Prosthecobacter debontii]